jgi:hypothetical protein
MQQTIFQNLNLKFQGKNKSNFLSTTSSSRSSSRSSSTSSSTASWPSIKIPSHQLPSSNTHEKWTSLVMDTPCAGGGNWIIFCHSSQRDVFWTKLIESASKIGIPMLKSTTKKWENENQGKSNIILAFCGPPSDGSACKNIGRRIKNLLEIDSTIYYKKESKDPNEMYLYKM